ncbi:hypothetical protein [Staphylococcus epidermidis]|uniref:hypothetical protein n=1 Tax=Staphylococcus epidermidis TaxID=1282 RepID=UPI00119FC7A6|nr:hypothetical protein [Staphylococcus epidermidis]
MKGGMKMRYIVGEKEGIDEFVLVMESWDENVLVDKCEEYEKEIEHKELCLEEDIIEEINE